MLSKCKVKENVEICKSQFAKLHTANSGKREIMRRFQVLSCAINEIC